MRERVEKLLENDDELVVSLHVEQRIRSRRFTADDIGEHRARFPARGLQSRLDPRQAADPFVDDREADGREVVRVDADVELVAVGAVIKGMRVTVQQRNTLVPARPVRRVPVGAV